MRHLQRYRGHAIAEKNGEKHMGYKNHSKADVESKFIIGYDVTPASVHDSRKCKELLGETDKGQEIYADSAYYSRETEKWLEKMDM